MLHNPELVSLQKDLAAIREESAQLLEPLDAGALNRRPSAEEWSIGQQFNQLNKIAAAFLPGIDAALVQLRSEGKTATGPFRYPFAERVLVRAMNPTGLMRKIMLPVPPMYEPTTEPLEPASLRGEFERYQERLARALSDADGLDLTAARLPSPAAARVVVSLGTWFHALIAHERYHLDKAIVVSRNQEMKTTIVEVIEKHL